MLSKSKVTDVQRTARRSYNQYCGLARALDVVGERWTLLIVRNLLLGPQRYSQLQRGLPGITTNLLAQRLREMEAAGLIEHVADPAIAPAYQLTPLGRDLEPAIHALGSWGWKRMGVPAPQDRRDIEWLLVSLRRRYRGGVSVRAELRVEGVPYRIVLDGAAADIARGAATAPEITIYGSADPIARLFILGPSPELKGAIEIKGSQKTFRTLLDAFTRGDASVVRLQTPGR